MFAAAIIIALFLFMVAADMRRDLKPIGFVPAGTPLISFDMGNYREDRVKEGKDLYSSDLGAVLTLRGEEWRRLKNVHERGNPLETYVRESDILRPLPPAGA